MQTTIVIIILLAACAFTFWRIYKTVSGKHHQCAGCSGCPINPHTRSCACGDSRKNWHDICKTCSQKY